MARSVLAHCAVDTDCGKLVHLPAAAAVAADTDATVGGDLIELTLAVLLMSVLVHMDRKAEDEPKSADLATKKNQNIAERGTIFVILLVADYSDLPHQAP